MEIPCLAWRVNPSNHTRLMRSHSTPASTNGLGRNAATVRAATAAATNVYGTARRRVRCDREGERGNRKRHTGRCPTHQPRRGHRSTTLAGVFDESDHAHPHRQDAGEDGDDVVFRRRQAVGDADNHLTEDDDREQTKSLDQ